MGEICKGSKLIGGIIPRSSVESRPFLSHLWKCLSILKSRASAVFKTDTNYITSVVECLN